MFRNREEAAILLYGKLKAESWYEPLVLAIPRGGVVLGAILAEKLDAELDVIVARKLRSPWSSELAIGAVAEGGRSHLTPLGEKIQKENPSYLAEEIRNQTEELENRVSFFRKVKSRSEWMGRSIVLVDDGIATGATFLSALQVIRAEKPRELIVAVPVLPKAQVSALKRLADKIVFLKAPPDFESVGQFYEDFSEVTFERALSLLQCGQKRIQHKQNMLN